MNRAGLMVIRSLGPAATVAATAIAATLPPSPSAYGIVAAEDEKRIQKPFGLGQGPFFVGGRDTDAEGTKIALTIYKQFLVYKKFLGKSFLEDEQYYDR